MNHHHIKNGFCKQIFGLPVGIFFSPNTANLVMEELENEVLKAFTFEILF